MADEETGSWLRLAVVFADGCVLQRGAGTQIWGTSRPGARISVTIQGGTATGKADAAGAWRISLPVLRAGGPYPLSVCSTALSGGRSLTRLLTRSVWVGEVYLCAGQSNMELPMSWIRDDNLGCFTHADPALRQLKIDAHYDLRRQHTDYPAGTTRWAGVAPETLGDFSALAYFFGRRMRERLGVPVGVINMSLGGSPISSWLSREVVRRFPSVDRELDGYLLPGEAERKSAASIERIHDWYHRLDTARREPADGEWRTVTMPDFLSAAGLTSDEEGPDSGDRPGCAFSAGFVGEVELRRTFTLTADQARKADEAARSGRAASGALLRLGTMADRDRTRLNGVLLGGHDNQYEVRDYEIPAGTLRAGTNEIRVRLVSEQGLGRMTPGKRLCLRLDDGDVVLDGRWRLAVTARMDRRCPTEDFVRWLPVGLHNAMLAPLAGYGVRAVLWYQGESDTGPRAGIYADLLRSLIRLWRSEWARSGWHRRLPFYVVQLPAFSIDTPCEDGGWPLVRQAEWDVARSEPDVTTVVTLPDGEWNDLHPAEKESVADRLALAVLQAGERSSTPVSQPVLDASRCRIDGNALTLAFRNRSLAPGHGPVPAPVRLRTSDGGAPGEFAFWWKTGGTTVVPARLESAAVDPDVRVRGVESGIRLELPARVTDEVRYAWSNAPATGLLQNDAGVLVPPFRLRLDDLQ